MGCISIKQLNSLILFTAASCFEKIGVDGKCSDLVANDATTEECCSALGVGYGGTLSDQAIFWVRTGIKREACKACKGKNFMLHRQILIPNLPFRVLRPC